MLIPAQTCLTLAQPFSTFRKIIIIINHIEVGDEMCTGVHIKVAKVNKYV